MIARVLRGTIVTAVAIVALFHLQACTFDPSGLDEESSLNDQNGNTDPCAGIGCSGHGTCVVRDGKATCECDDGYVARGTRCVKPDANPCDGVTCSGHGQCMVQQGEAVCVCDQGYTNGTDPLTCVVDATALCSGVDCSGHGTCTVDGTTPVCLCEQGYVNGEDPLTCVPGPNMSCASNDDCAEGLYCSPISHTCIVKKCGYPPPMELNGRSDEYGPCTPGVKAGQECTFYHIEDGTPVGSPSSCLSCNGSMICVPGVEPLSKGYPESDGVCLEPCNPCDDDPCDVGEVCVPIEPQGGVCMMTEPFADEGQPCATTEFMGTDMTGFVSCKPGLECVQDGGMWTCMKPCRPDLPFTSTDGQASTSPDCAGGTVCVSVYMTNDGVYHGFCMSGDLADGGSQCSESLLTYCKPPYTCQWSDFGYEECQLPE